MPDALVNGSADSKIILVMKEYFEQWSEAQPAELQQWFKANNYKGKGVLILPGSGTESTQAVYGLSDLNDFFLAGDLPTLLPENTYQADFSAFENDASIDEELTNLLQFRFSVSWGLAAYQFEQYKKIDATVARLAIEDEALLSEVNNVVAAISLTRDLINTPANDMMPEDLAHALHALAQSYGGSYNEVVGDDLLDQNYPLIHAVGRASDHAPRLLELRWGDPDAPTITLVGKGICFDSGGLNIKVGNFMRNMKKDMGGAAHVLGLARLIMSQGLPVHLRVLVAAAENAISGNALRPGDIVTSRKGLTVEIDNTDAEGRLVLCDALDDACSESPELVIDFATLTGACRVALGTELPGFFCNDESVAAGLTEAANLSLDPVWRLPLHKPYNAMLDSQVADLVNSASVPFGGAITAALYLQNFVDDATPWVHFDVMAWNIRKLPGRPIGGEALGLRAVYEYLKQRFC